MADKEFEGGASVKAILDIARRHGELIEVGEETGIESAREHAAEEIMPVGKKAQRIERETLR